MSLMHCHLDPVGGLAGDMFCATMLAAFPALAESLQTDLSAAGVLEHVRVQASSELVNGLSATLLSVTAHDRSPRATGHYQEIRQGLQASSLAPEVSAVALGIFDLLAQAEARVHDVPVARVHFHEVADWDSIADIVGAASLIVRSGVNSWSCGSLPVGGGTVKTAHGVLPVPAPATALLLEGLELHDDGQAGERVTPTGAAIVRYLVPAACPAIPRRPAGRLIGTGTGCGTLRFESIPNILRVLVLSVESGAGSGVEPETRQDTVALLHFEIDDMTPEELATALDRLRDSAGVLDISYQLRLAKKGRPQFAVQVIAQLDSMQSVVRLCLTETSTLGVRISEQQRCVLRRESASVQLDGREIPVKHAWRPGGIVSTKVEADALAATASLVERRRIAASGDGND